MLTWIGALGVYSGSLDQAHGARRRVGVEKGEGALKNLVQISPDLLTLQIQGLNRIVYCLLRWAQILCFSNSGTQELK